MSCFWYIIKHVCSLVLVLCICYWLQKPTDSEPASLEISQDKDSEDLFTGGELRFLFNQDFRQGISKFPLFVCGTMVTILYLHCLTFVEDCIQRCILRSYQLHTDRRLNKAGHSSPAYTEQHNSGKTEYFSDETDPHIIFCLKQQKTICCEVKSCLYPCCHKRHYLLYVCAS